MKLRMIPAANPSWNTGESIEFEIDDGEARLTQGFGGWETVSRPQRIALTRYVGNDPIGQEVPILLDGFATDTDVEPLLASLLGQSRVAGDDSPPTIWRLSGPVFYPEKRWVVSGIDLGDLLRVPRRVIAPVFDADGTVIGTRETDLDSAILARQRATISFLEYVPADQIRVRRIRRKFKPRGKKKRIKAEGRSIKKIAVEFYGTGARDVVRALGKAQRPPIRDVKKKLPKDRVIRLPVLRV